MQKLILPINTCLITAGYRNEAYLKKFGFPHYGMDLISVPGDRKIYSSGTGLVLAQGLDSVVGNVLIIRYPQSYNNRTGTTADLVLRYYHLNSIAVAAGDTVNPGTLLGVYGNTGKYSAGPHLHVEVDYDIKYFVYSATVGKDGTLIRAGNNRTMCAPGEVLFVKAGAPELQSCIASKGSLNGVPFVMPSDLPSTMR